MSVRPPSGMPLMRNGAGTKKKNIASFSMSNFNKMNDPNQILITMREPVPELIAAYPHANFAKAVRVAEQENSKGRGPVAGIGGPNISYFRAIGRRVLQSTARIMAEQEAEYQRHGPRYNAKTLREMTRKRKEEANLLGLNVQPAAAAAAASNNLLRFPTTEEELASLFTANGSAAGAGGGAGSNTSSRGGRRTKRRSTRRQKKN